MLIIKHLAAAALAVGMLAVPAWAGIGKGQHVNIISFQQDDEFKGTMDYPESVTGSFGDVLKSLAGKAEPFLMIHTPHIHPKDTVNAQLDALGERTDGSMEDDGLNCEFLFDEAGKAFTLGGVCHVIYAGEKDNTTDKFILKPQAIPSTGKHETPVWKRLFVNAATGTAFYASIER